LHLRSRDARRQHPGRPQSEVDHSLGLGRERHRRRGANLRKLFTKENPSEVEEGQDFTANLNPNSLEIITNAKLEPSLANAAAGSRYQFERLGYFCVDPDSRPGKPMFNRTVALKDTWAKVEKKQPRARIQLGAT
jgi:hypothetical protein